MPIHNPQSAIEKQYSKDHYETVNASRDPIKINWDIVDHATAQYAEVLKDYDFAAIMNSLVARYEKGSSIQVMPMAGNLDYTDREVRFESFFNSLEANREHAKQTLTHRFTPKAIDNLRSECVDIVNYITSGQHSDPELRFGGWARAFKNAKQRHRKLCIGVISVDIPYASYDKNGRRNYRPSGTQHYVSFAYELATHKLFLFDSASKNAVSDKSEVYFILQFVFEHLEQGSITIHPVKFPYILQPGAGDQKHEHERSYNNQNVFCHTWSLWFGTLVCMFYDDKQGMEKCGLLKMLYKCAHKNNLLNLAMIKRFALWLSAFLVSEEDELPPPSSPKRQRRLAQNATQTYIKRTPLGGLRYVWNYKTNKSILIEDLCVARKVKMDIAYVDEEVPEFTSASFHELVVKKRCHLGYVLNPSTNRCRKIRST